MLPHSRGPALRALVLIAALLASFFAFVAPANAATDTDKDGLPDSWEKKGGKAPGGLDIYKLGARYNHKDVFVEINYATNATFKTKVTCAGLDALWSAWDKAPVTNPDKKNGVKLHLDAGKTCPSRSYNLKGSGKVTLSSCTVGSTIGLASNRKPVFHNGLVVEPRQLCPVNGEVAAGIASGRDFAVQLRGGGIDWSFVTLHEMGHTFGLSHSAFNSFSVMSPTGVNLYAKSGSGKPYVDFTRFPVLPLDEKALDEHVGYTSGSPEGDIWLSTLFGPQYCDRGGPKPELEQTWQAHGDIDFNCSKKRLDPPPYDQYLDSALQTYDVDGDGDTNGVPGVPAQWPTVVAHLGDGRIGG